MGKFLIKAFIKNSDDVKDPAVRESYGKLAGTVGIVSNLLLCIAKIIIGIFSKSIAIIADGINNLADASSSIITLVGFKLAALPEDEDHPYGHARYEYLTGLFVSILIIVIGLQLFKSSIDKILNPEPVKSGWILIAVLILAILVKLWQAAFYRLVGKRINSLTLTATAADSRNDVIATSAVLVSVLVGKFSGLQIDGYMGCLVALFILWSGIQLVRETSSPLLGEAPDEELVSLISDTVMSQPGVLGIHDLMVHNYGPGKIFASIHVEVDAAEDLMKSHDMIDNVERMVKEQLKIEFIIHMDPVAVNDPTVNRLKSVIGNAFEFLDGVEGFHDLRIVTGPTHTNVIFDVVLSSGCTLKEDEIKKAADDALSAENGKYFTVITFDKAYTNLN